MTVLHILRDAADPEAGAVIREQIGQGVDLAVVALSGGAPELDCPRYVLGGEGPPGSGAVSWNGLLGMIFEARTVVTW